MLSVNDFLVKYWVLTIHFYGQELREGRGINQFYRKISLDDVVFFLDSNVFFCLGLDFGHLLEFLQDFVEKKKNIYVQRVSQNSLRQWCLP